MPLVAHSEWMKAQKHASLLAPGKDFKVIQTSSGTSIFFSIGSDDILYASREVTGTPTGWDRQDLTSTLESLVHPNDGKFIVKAFCVSQQLATLSFDLAVVISSSRSAKTYDQLFVSLNHANDDASWANAIQWQEMRFDASQEDRQQVIIHSLDILTAPADDLSATTCIVDILRDPSKTTVKLLDRYYLDFSSTTHWIRHTLAIDLSADHIASTPGWRSDDPISGIYTLGELQGRPQLIYAMRYNCFGTAASGVSRLAIPKGATTMATSFYPSDSVSYSTLFVSCSEGIVTYPPDKQEDRSTGISILDDPLTPLSTDLCAQTAGGITALWGVGPNGALWYTHCAAGKETIKSEWAAVIPLLPSVENFSFYSGKAEGKLTLFAHVHGDEMTSLTQDPVTLDWTSKPILLPGTDVNHMVEFDSFTTRIEVRDDTGQVVPAAKVALTATSAVAVFIDNVYHLIHPDIPLTIAVDLMGALSIVQEVKDVTAVAFRASLVGVDTGDVSVRVDPTEKGWNVLSGIDSVDKLNAATVKDPLTGEHHPLVDPSVSHDDKHAAVEALKQFVVLAKQLPSDGSRHDGSVSGTGSGSTSGFFADVPPLNFGQAIRVPPRDLFSKIKNGIEDALDFALQLVDDAWHFICKIGETIYHAVLDCLAAVGHAVQWVFDKIKIGIEKVIQYISFLFEWKDIVRTHHVIRNWFNVWALHAIDKVADIEEDLDTALKHVDEQVKSWAGIGLQGLDEGQPIGQTINSTDQANGHKSLSSPQSQWSIQHFKNHIADGKVDEGNGKQINISTDMKNKIKLILEDVKAMVETEVDVAKAAWQSFLDDIITPLNSLTPLEVIKRVIGIIARFGIQTARNILVKTLDILRLASVVLLDLVNLPLEIPILSPLYKRIANADLTILDVCCLVAAVPATVMFKLVVGHAPFADDEMTRALISAKDATAFNALAFGGSPIRDNRSPIHVGSDNNANGHQIKLMAMANYRPMTARAVIPMSVPTDGKSGNGNQGGVVVAASNKPEPVHNKYIYKVFVVLNDLIGGIAALAFTIVSISDDLTNHVSLVRIPIWFLYITPNITAAFEEPGSWPSVMDDIVFTSTFFKVCADRIPLLHESDTWKTRVSPSLDIIFNCIWIFPAGGRLGTSKQFKDVASFLASLLADLGGISFGIRDLADKKANVHVWLAASGAGICASTSGAIAAGIAAFPLGFDAAEEGLK